MSNDEHTARILIVDDEPRNVLILEELLDGYELETAVDGIDGLEKVESFRPDLVLLDIMMPRMDGYEVCRRIRSDPEFRFKKIIFVSGRANNNERLAGYEAGADDYVVKPFDHDEIIAKVQVFLRLKNAEEICQLKDEFMSLVAHETRAPMSAILSLSELILHDDRLEREQINGFCNEICQSGAKLMSFLDNILFLRRLKSSYTVRTSKHEARQVLTDAVQTVSDVFPGTNLELDMGSLTNVVLKCDATLLTKAIYCVVDQAVRLSEPGQTICVRGEREERSAKVLVSTPNEVTPELAEILFTEFSLEDNEHDARGHGLSMAIAKRIVQIHGGSAHIDVQPGEGTTFSLRFPISRKVLAG